MGTFYSPAMWEGGTFICVQAVVPSSLPAMRLPWRFFSLPLSHAWHDVTLPQLLLLCVYLTFLLCITYILFVGGICVFYSGHLHLGMCDTALYVFPKTRMVGTTTFVWLFIRRRYLPPTNLEQIYHMINLPPNILYHCILCCDIVFCSFLPSVFLYHMWLTLRVVAYLTLLFSLTFPVRPYACTIAGGLHTFAAFSAPHHCIYYRLADILFLPSNTQLPPSLHTIYSVGPGSCCSCDDIFPISHLPFSWRHC